MGRPPVDGRLPSLLARMDWTLRLTIALCRFGRAPRDLLKLAGGQDLGVGAVLSHRPRDGRARLGLTGV